MSELTWVILFISAGGFQGCSVVWDGLQHVCKLPGCGLGGWLVSSTVQEVGLGLLPMREGQFNKDSGHPGRLRNVLLCGHQSRLRQGGRRSYYTAPVSPCLSVHGCPCPCLHISTTCLFLSRSPPLNLFSRVVVMNDHKPGGIKQSYFLTLRRAGRCTALPRTVRAGVSAQWSPPSRPCVHGMPARNS